MTELVRVAALTGYFQAMESLGFDCMPLIREAGLSRKLLSQPEQLISARTVVRLLERSAEHSGCRFLGLLMAPRRGLADIGVTSLLIQHEPTLRDVLLALSRYRNRINPIVALQIEEMGDRVLIRVTLSVNETGPTRQASNLALSALVRLCSLVVGKNWRPEMVCLTHEAPPSSDLPIYRRVFNCRVDFDAECNGIVIHSRDLDLPSQHADSAMAEHARNLIECTAVPEHSSRSHQIAQALLLLLPSGDATIHSCSALLGVTVRTLQRNLDAEGTSFSRLLHEARMRLANEYLANTRTPLSQVAVLLGYGSLGAFTHWHQQTYGMSPSDGRKHLQKSRT